MFSRNIITSFSVSFFPNCLQTQSADQRFFRPREFHAGSFIVFSKCLTYTHEQIVVRGITAKLLVLPLMVEYLVAAIRLLNMLSPRCELYCGQFASGVTPSFTALLILTLPGGQNQESSTGPLNHLQGLMETPPPSGKSTTEN